MIKTEVRENIKRAMIRRCIEDCDSKVIPRMSTFTGWLCYPETYLNISLSGSRICEMTFFEGLHIILDARMKLHTDYGFSFQDDDVLQ